MARPGSGVAAQSLVAIAAVPARRGGAASDDGSVASIEQVSNDPLRSKAALHASSGYLRLHPPRRETVEGADPTAARRRVFSIVPASNCTGVDARPG